MTDDDTTTGDGNSYVESDEDEVEDPLTGWNYLSIPTSNSDNVSLEADSGVEKLLLDTLKNEIQTIGSRVLARTNNNSNLLLEVSKLLIDPLIPCWTDAANAGNNEADTIVEQSHMREFITIFSYLSYYQKTHTIFFGNKAAHPPATSLNQNVFTRVLKGFSSPQRDTLPMSWDGPVKPCFSVSTCERRCNETNSTIAYIPNVSILSQDDDQYRLRSKLCEDIGLVRVNNPKKAFGPVSTGSVSLTSGITLSVHLSIGSESSLMTTKILMMNLLNVALPEQVKGKNIVAMDRGYWSTELVEYLSGAGFQLVGTYKRTQSSAFTFGDVSRRNQNQQYIPEIGCKTVYWAKKKVGQVNSYALAYRDGNGHVTTLFTTIRDIPLYTFHYIRKKDAVISHRSPQISNEMNKCVEELTHGQGGVEWHIIRATCGGITSTVASKFMRLCYSDMTDLDKSLLIQGLGVQPQAPRNTYTREVLSLKTCTQLKEILRNEMNLPVTGNKSQLIDRILETPPIIYDIRQEMLNVWFMKPLKTSPALKIGRENEKNIADKIIQFFSDNSSTDGTPYNVSFISEVGLVRSKTCTSLYTSADRLCFLSIGPRHNIGPWSCHYLCPVEIKTVVKDSTEDAALRRLSQIRQGKRIIPVCFGTEDFKSLVWNTSYRTQVLHHAAVLNSPFVLFAVGSTSKILYIAIIEFPSQIRVQYMDFSNRMNTEYLQWYTEPTSTFPTNMDCAHAKDLHTLTFWKQLQKSVQNFLDKNTDIPPAHDIRPYLVVLWNRLKGGQDVVSRQLKNVKVDFKHLTPRAFVFLRQILTQLLNCHLILRLVQVYVSGVDDFTSYESLKKHLNHKSTFENFLWEFAETWDREVVDGNTSGDPGNQMTTPPRVPKKNRVPFFNTPEGKRLRLSNVGHNQESSKKRNRCMLCRMNTTCRCVECGVYLCRQPFGNHRKSCWHKHHNNQRLVNLER